MSVQFCKIHEAVSVVERAFWGVGEATLDVPSLWVSLSPPPQTWIESNLIGGLWM